MDYIQIDINIQPREPWVDIFSAELGALGCDSFEETPSGVAAYIPEENYAIEIENYLEEQKASLDLSYTIKKIEAQNWNAVWEASFDPINVENWTSILAPFHEKIPGVEHEIIIEPKMSFGTGHHQTTYMMVLAMREQNFQNKSVLDMGTGTGILGILAHKLGANDVLGIDIEAWAVENCIENCQVNQAKMEVLLGGKEQIPQGKIYDIILANINRNILLDQANIYAQSLVKGGKLFLSGFLQEDEEVIFSGFEEWFELDKKYTKDHWLCLVLSKK